MTIRPIFLLIFIFFSFSSCVSGHRSSSKKIAQQDSLRIMTYNIHHAAPAGTNDVNTASIAAVINRYQPALVALQEVDVNTRRSGIDSNQAALIAAASGMQFYFAKSIDYDGGEYGIAILSKYPLSGAMHVRLPQVAGGTTEPRTLATAVVHLPGGKKILFACTHLDSEKSDSTRLLQLEYIAQALKGKNMPVIIAGDFNTTSGSEAMQKFDKSFTQSCTVCPPTFPVGTPRKTIDYIAYSPATALQVHSHSVLPEHTQSDHLPVMVVATLNNGD